MRNLLILALIFLSFTANAQLYVAPTVSDASYIYINDIFIYIDQDVELETNSILASSTQNNIPNVVLRNGSQLLQGNGSDQLSKGTGDVSIYQEGTTNQWDYNLWASPVGVAHNDDGTERAAGNGIFAFRDSNTSSVSVPQSVFYVPAIGGAGVEVNSNNALIGTGLNGVSGPSSGQLSIASFWIYGYEAGNATADFIPVQSTGSLPAGLGFTMKGVSGSDPTDAGDGVANNLGILGDGLGQRIDFKGRPNNGTITAIVNTGTQTITGNPYPSALDLNYFLLLNSGSGTINTTLPSGNSVNVSRTDVIDGMAYFWESDPSAQTHFIEEYQAGYGVYSPMGLLATDGMYVAAQYFMYDEDGNPIGGTIGSGDVTLKRRFAPVAQGFMVVGSDTQISNTFMFTNNMRIFVKEGNNSDFRSNENTAEDETLEAIGVGTYYDNINNLSSFPQFKVGININDTYGRELGVGILDNATRGYDKAMDGKAAGLLANDVTFSINEKDQYVINAIPDDEYQALVLSINAEVPSEFRLRARDIKHFNYEGIFLFDTISETYFDIQNESVLLQLPIGNYPKRFEIRFTREVEEDNTPEEDTSEEEEEEEEETTEEDTDWEEDSQWEQEDETLSIEEIVSTESILESFSIFQNNNASQLEIRNPNRIALINVTLFDILGKQIFLSQDLSNNNLFIFPTSQLSPGIYIVKFTTDNGLTKARKIHITQ